eukprot:454731_1
MSSFCSINSLFHIIAYPPSVSTSSDLHFKGNVAPNSPNNCVEVGDNMMLISHSLDSYSSVGVLGDVTTGIKKSVAIGAVRLHWTNKTFGSNKTFVSPRIDR